VCFVDELLHPFFQHPFEGEEEAFDESQVFGDDFGGGFHFVGDGKRLAVVGCQAVREGDFDIAVVFGGDERDAFDNAVDDAELLIGEVHKTDDHPLTCPDLARTLYRKQSPAKQLIFPVRNDRKDIFTRRNKLILIPVLGKSHFPIDGRQKAVVQFPTVDGIGKLFDVCTEIL